MLVTTTRLVAQQQIQRPNGKIHSFVTGFRTWVKEKLDGFVDALIF